MTQEDFQVVAELYQLLAKFPPKAIQAASRKSSISTNIRRALMALYLEARAAHDDHASHFEQAASLSHVRDDPREGKPKELRSRLRTDLQSALSDQARFPSVHALVELERDLGLKPSISRKDGRERAARKIIRAATTSESKLRKLLELLGIPQSNQTEGWLNLILSNK